MEKIHSYSLDAILDSSHETSIVKDVRRDIDAVLVRGEVILYLSIKFWVFSRPNPPTYFPPHKLYIPACLAETSRQQKPRGKIKTADGNEDTSQRIEREGRKGFETHPPKCRSYIIH
jgi:hypothetical protein